MVYGLDYPEFTTQTAVEYKGNIDGSVRALGAVVGQFAPSETQPPSMGIIIDAGLKPQAFGPRYAISKLSDLTVGPTNISGIGAPATGQKQMHVISLSWETFTFTRSFSAAQPNSTADDDMPWPDVPNGNMVICAIVVKGGSTYISNADIYDLRTVYKPDFVHSDGAGGNVIMTDKNGSGRVQANAFGDRLELMMVAATGKVQVKVGSTVVAEFDGNGNLNLKGTVGTIP